MRLLTFLALMIAGVPAFAQPVPKTEDLIAEAQRRMQVRLETKEFEEKMPFSKFLQRLEEIISKEKKFAIHFDRDAFGKDADKMLKTEVELPPVPVRMTVSTALRIALSQVNEAHEIEFTARPSAFVITTRDRSLFTAHYPIDDWLKHTRYLHEILLEQAKHNEGRKHEFPNAEYDLKADPAKAGEWIVRQIMASPHPNAGWHGRTPASTISIRNGTLLEVHTAPSVHAEIDQLLWLFRRLVDVAVVMNAKVYALDRAEYDAHFGPAFVDLKDKSARGLAATVTDAQWKRLQAMKPIFESDADKLRPLERTSFLSRMNAYQYQAAPGGEKPTTAFEGFSFAVRPVVSPDRRCMRLEIFHDVQQLVKLTKGAMLDMKTGKEMPIELPNLRKSSASATIEIQDGQPILLAVDYRLKDKVWLVLAEPRIYIEEEEEYLKKSAIRRMPLADEKPAPPEPPDEPLPPRPPPTQLPDSDDVKQILQAVVENVLTDPTIKGTLAFYGTPEEKKFQLDNDSNHYLWPKGFRPSVAGFTEENLTGKCRGFLKRLAGIRIDGFDLAALKTGKKEVAIRVVVHNVGGSINGAVIGGCHLSYVATRDGKRWKVDLNELFDP